VSDNERQQLDFELPNVGRGRETVRARNLVADGDYQLVVLLGSHYCSRSRELVRTLAGCHDAFQRRGTTVVPVLPDIRERARVWHRQYSLPFPLLVDPAEDEGGDERGGTVEPLADDCDTGAFDAFGPLQASVGELPAVALCRPGEDGLTVVATETEATLDAPVVESLLAFVDRHRTTDAAPAGNTAVDS